MPFSRNTLQEIVDRIVSDFQTRITGATSLLRRSTLRIIARVNAGAFHLLYEYLDFQARQLFVSTADEAGLDTHASEYGISRKASVFATGSGQAAGINGITIVAGTELMSTDDLTYLTLSDVIVVTGTATLDFIAKEAGADSNDDGGIILSFVSPIAGIETTFTVDSTGITGGTDEETDTELRARVLYRKRYPSHSGADFDYEAWTLEVEGVTRAWAIPGYQGVGTIGVAFTRDNDASLIPDSEQRAEVRAYIVFHEDPLTGLKVGCPVTAEPGLFIIDLSFLTVDFEVAISPNTAAVQAEVEANLRDLLLTKGGPGETVYLSEINEAISLAHGENMHRLILPATDVGAVNIQIHSFNSITFTDY